LGYDMILWINGAFGSGKSTAAYELHRRLPDSFVYDPENVGYFLRKNEPPQMKSPDFQNEPLWRSFNLQMMKNISEHYGGTVIAPMTLNNPAYYEEIIGGLRKSGVRVDHYVLWAGREVLLKRLRGRLDGKNSWAAGQIDICLRGFDNPLFENRINTEKLGVGEIVEQIAQASGLSLLPDHRSRLSQWISQKIISIRQIR